MALLTQSAGSVEYTDCHFAVDYDSPNECRDMTENNPMVKLQ